MKHVYLFRQVLAASLLFTSQFAISQGGVLDQTTFGSGVTQGATGGSNFLSAATLDASQNILVGGSFSNFNNTSINNFARVLPNGSTDLSFTTGTGPNGFVRSVSVRSGDGEIIIGGTFGTYNSTGRTKVARINTDGTLDLTFAPTGTGINGGDVFGTAIQTDGDVIVVGTFTAYNVTSTGRIARLNGTTGALDATFTTNNGTGANGTINRVIIQPTDGKIIIVGAFTQFNGVNSPGVARINTDGTLDATFSTNLGTGVTGLTATVNAVAIQPSDNKIIIGGDFNAVSSNTAIRVARLNTDGTFDNTLSMATGPNLSVIAAAVLADGKILLGGSFGTVKSITRAGIVRLSTTGDVDLNFLPGAGTNAPVNNFGIQSDGKILVVGAFTQYNGVANPRNRIARICGDLSAATTAQVATITTVSTTNPLALGSTDCSVVAKVVPNGGTPVSGNVTVNLTLDGTAQYIGNIPYVRRRYEINPATGSTARVTLYYTQADFDDFNTTFNGNDLPFNGADVEGNKANIRFTKFSGTSTGGTGNPGDFVPGVQSLIDPVDTDIVWNATTSKWEVTFDVSGFSGFFMQTNPLLLLPVNLKTFTAAAVQGGAKLNWSTATEQNSSHFVVERSVDGNNYRSAGRINAAGNSQSTRNYSLVDDLSKVPHGGVIYYRLYMVDKDGTGMYSKVQTVKPGKSNAGAALLTNPVGAEARILYQANVGEKVTLRLLDSRGQLVSQRQEQVAAGSNQIRIATANLAKGIYMLEVTGNGERNTIRLVKE